MSTDRPRPGAPVPPFTVPRLGGGTITIGGERERWSVLFVYRGRHCPRCKRFLAKLDAALPDWTALMDVMVVSADTEAKAKADRDEFGWDFELGYGLGIDDARALGLYISEPLSEAETDAPFAEPGTFAMRPDGTLMLVDISNGPAARPDLEELLSGMRFNIENDRPTRGTA